MVKVVWHLGWDFNGNFPLMPTVTISWHHQFLVRVSEVFWRDQLNCIVSNPSRFGLWMIRPVNSVFYEVILCNRRWLSSYHKGVRCVLSEASKTCLIQRHNPIVRGFLHSTPHIWRLPIPRIKELNFRICRGVLRCLHLSRIHIILVNRNQNLKVWQTGNLVGVVPLERMRGSFFRSTKTLTDYNFFVFDDVDQVSTTFVCFVNLFSCYFKMGMIFFDLENFLLSFWHDKLSRSLKSFV